MENNIEKTTLESYIEGCRDKRYFTSFAERLFLAEEIIDSYADGISLGKASNIRRVTPFFSPKTVRISELKAGDELDCTRFCVTFPEYEMMDREETYSNYSYGRNIFFERKHIGKLRDCTVSEVYKNADYDDGVYTVASLLFYVCFCCNPFCGREYYSTLDDSRERDKEFFSSAHKFIFDLNNNPNRFVNGYHYDEFSVWQCFTDKQKSVFSDALGGRTQKFSEFYSKWKEAFSEFNYTYSQARCGEKLPTIAFPKDKRYLVLSERGIGIDSVRCRACSASIASKCEACPIPPESRETKILSLPLKFAHSEETVDENGVKHNNNSEVERVVYCGMTIDIVDFPSSKKEDVYMLFRVIPTKKYDLLGLECLSDADVCAEWDKTAHYTKGGKIALLPGMRITLFGNHTITVPGTPPPPPSPPKPVQKPEQKSAPLPESEQKPDPDGAKDPPSVKPTENSSPSSEIKLTRNCNPFAVYDEAGNGYEAVQKNEFEKYTRYYVKDVNTRKIYAMKLFDSKGRSEADRKTTIAMWNRRIDKIRDLMRYALANDSLRYPVAIVDTKFTGGICGCIYEPEPPSARLLSCVLDDSTDAAPFESQTVKLIAMKNMCDVTARLHSSNFCYGKLSHKHVKVDTTDGKVYFIDNESVCRSGDPYYYIAVDEGMYTAPELLQYRMNIDRIADDFSLAVLLFVTYFGIHPFNGYGLNDIDKKCGDRDVEECMLADPVFIFGGNGRNKFFGRLSARMKKDWNNAPDELKEMFSRAFTSGIRPYDRRRNNAETERAVVAERSKRPTAKEWSALLEKIVAELIRTNGR